MEYVELTQMQSRPTITSQTRCAECRRPGGPLVRPCNCVAHSACLVRKILNQQRIVCPRCRQRYLGVQTRTGSTFLGLPPNFPYLSWLIASIATLVLAFLLFEARNTRNFNVILVLGIAIGLLIIGAAIVRTVDTFRHPRIDSVRVLEHVIGVGPSGGVRDRGRDGGRGVRYSWSAAGREVFSESAETGESWVDPYVRSIIAGDLSLENLEALRDWIIVKHYARIRAVLSGNMSEEWVNELRELVEDEVTEKIVSVYQRMAANEEN